jgi:hypothetical protein
MKPDPECPRRVKTLIAEETAPKEDDTWWSRAKIDIRDGLLATELTPPQFVQDRFGFAIPEDVEGFARTQAQEWASRLGASYLPTERSTGVAPIRIANPRDGQRVPRIVEIAGQADGPGFVAYRLEYGEGDPPLAWTTLLRSETPQPGGGLALWNTDGLPPGDYTLRLIMETSDRGELSTYIVVRIGSSGAFPGITPTAEPDEQEDD